MFQIFGSASVIGILGQCQSADVRVMLLVWSPPPPPHGGGGEALEDGRRGSGSGDDGAGPERQFQDADTGGFQGGFEVVGEEDAAVEERIDPEIGALSGIGMNS